METPQRYPLYWPPGYPRARSRMPAVFSKKVDTGRGYSQSKKLSVSDAVLRLEAQLELLRAIDPVLSTNVQLTLSGQPRSSQPEPPDPGAAVYFTLNGKPIAMACDRWDRVADNIAALAKHIEALRGMDRWGVGTTDQLFAGYTALPAPEQWFNVLGVSSNAARDEIKAAFIRLANEHHPDKGGSDEMMGRLLMARDAGFAQSGEADA